MVAQLADLRLQLLDLRREPRDVVGQRVDGALLLIRVGWTVECLPPKGRFKEPEEGARPTEVGLIDLPRH